MHQTYKNKLVSLIVRTKRIIYDEMNLVDVRGRCIVYVVRM